MGCCGCNKNSLKCSVLLTKPENPVQISNNSKNEIFSEENQFSETENPINNSQINEKDINIEKQQKYNENNIQYPPYEEELGIIDSQIRTEKV